MVGKRRAWARNHVKAFVPLMSKHGAHVPPGCSTVPAQPGLKMPREAVGTA